MRRTATSWLSAFTKLGFKVQRRGAGPTRRSSGSRGRRLVAEPLEERRLLATLFTVDTFDDDFDPLNPTTDGEVSLREAVLAANSNMAVGDALAGNGTDRIQFSSSLFEAGPATINLASALAITDDVTIDGLEPDRLILDAGLNDRVLVVVENVAATLSDMTIQGGSAISSDGGGILNKGDLTLESVIVTGNQAARGGGIANLGGCLTIVLSDIHGNTVTSSGYGAGVYSVDFQGRQASTNIDRSTIAQNTGALLGGGIASLSGGLEVYDSTVWGNQAHHGAGILSISPIGAAIANTTISTNTATSQGGGVLLAGSLASIEHELTNVTITENRSPSGGGLVTMLGSGASLTANNSIISGNKKIVNNNADDISSTSYATVIGANNIIGTMPVGFFSPTGNFLGVTNPQLAPLGNYGGPTLTHVPLAGGIAVDTGNNQFVFGTRIVSDQRGYDRILDGNNNAVPVIDIGAVEYFPLPADIFSTLDSVPATPTVLDVALNNQSLHVHDRDHTNAIHEKQILDALFASALPGITLIPNVDPFDADEDDDGFVVEGHISGGQASVGVYTNFLPHHDNTFGLGPYGVALSTGDASAYGTAPNTTNNFGISYGSVITNGDLFDLLQSITPEASNFQDPSTLTIHFNAQSGVTELGFNVVFGTEEYSDFVNDEEIDAFGVFINGVQHFPTIINYAPALDHPSRIHGSPVQWGGTDPNNPGFIAPGTVISPPQPINANHPQMSGIHDFNNNPEINDVDAFNSGGFNSGPAFGLVGHAVSELDGVVWPHTPFMLPEQLLPGETPVLQYRIPINALNNTLTFVLADSEDGVFDSTVFISAFDVTPRVTNVVIAGPNTKDGNQLPTNGMYEVPTGTGEQLRTVSVGGANKVSISFSANVGYDAAAQNRVRDSLHLINKLSEADVTPAINNFNWNATTNTATWTFATALQAAPYSIVLDDAIIDNRGVPLDGDWTNPTNLNQGSAGLKDLSVEGSGDGFAGGEFEFYFTYLPADFDHNNIVNSSDLSIWSANFGGTTKSQSQGDTDGDMDVDGTDFLKWQGQIGSNFDDWVADGVLAPVVTNVVISGSASTHAPYSFDAAIDGGTNQLVTVPVGGSNTIQITFSKDVTVPQSALILRDKNDPLRTFSVSNFTTTAHSATWTFSQPFGPAALELTLSTDVIDHADCANALNGFWDNPANLAEIGVDAFPSGDAIGAESFVFHFTNLPADFNRDNMVNSADQSIWSANFGTPSGASHAMGDTDGDGDVDGSDFLEWQQEVGMNIDWQDWLAASLITDPGEPMTLLVSSLADELDGDISAGHLSLREALALADQYDGPDIIVFDTSLTSGTITLANNLDRLLVDSDVEINGLGANQLTVNGGGTANYQGVFLVETGVTASIRNLKVTGGYAISGPPGTTGPYSGGGVHNRGDLTLDHVIVTGNTSFNGGGIAQETSGASLYIVDSTISNNQGYSPGGGLYASAGTVDVVSSAFVNNTAVMGGGVYLQGSAALTMFNTTLSGNQNEAFRIAVATTSTALIVNSTIANNTQSVYMPSPYTAGGVNGSNGSIKLINTIVAGNTGGDINGTLNSLSHHSLIGNGSEGNLVNGTNNNMVGTTAIPINARMTALGNYGGPTQTHALLYDSLAIDAGDNDAVEELELLFDQRGYDRIVDWDADLDAIVDIGAFELALEELYA